MDRDDCDLMRKPTVSVGSVHDCISDERVLLAQPAAMFFSTAAAGSLVAVRDSRKVVGVSCLRAGEILWSVESSEILPGQARMPKVPISDRKRRENYVKEFGPEFFTTDGSVLTCKLCEKAVNDEKRYFVQQHIRSAGH